MGGLRRIKARKFSKDKQLSPLGQFINADATIVYHCLKQHAPCHACDASDRLLCFLSRLATAGNVHDPCVVKNCGTFVSTGVAVLLLKHLPDSTGRWAHSSSSARHRSGIATTVPS
jgi:hypothetical protein